MQILIEANFGYPVILGPSFACLDIHNIIFPGNDSQLHCAGSRDLLTMIENV